MRRRHNFTWPRLTCLCLALAGIYLLIRSFSIPVMCQLNGQDELTGFTVDAGRLAFFRITYPPNAPAVSSSLFSNGVKAKPLDIALTDSWMSADYLTRAGASLYGFGYVRPVIVAASDDRSWTAKYSDVHLPILPPILFLLIPPILRLIAALRRPRLPAVPCRQCDYDLQGHASANTQQIRCPECGTDQIPSPAPALRPRRQRALAAAMPHHPPHTPRRRSRPPPRPPLYVHRQRPLFPRSVFRKKLGNASESPRP